MSKFIAAATKIRAAGYPLKQIEEFSSEMVHRES